MNGSVIDRNAVITARRIRNLRKKLLQIEILKGYRHCNAEEELKVSNLEIYRKELATLLSSETMKRRCSNEETTESPVDDKRQCTWTKPEYPVNFVTLDLKGNEDITLCVDLDAIRDLIVTGCRDTTVSVWSFASADYLWRFGGHTGPVTCVSIIPKTPYQHKNLVLSGSLDCSLTIWDLDQGNAFRTIYTFNGINCLALIKKEKYEEDELDIMTGTDGGKIEFFCLKLSNSNENVDTMAIKSIHAYESSAVSGIDISQGISYMAASISLDGELKIWNLEDMSCLFVYCDDNCTLEALANNTASVKFVGNYGLLVAQGFVDSLKLFYQNDCQGGEHKRWSLHHFTNHEENKVGFTEALDIVVSSNQNSEFTIAVSAFDVDTGQGYINLYTPSKDIAKYLTYIGSLKKDVGRILNLSLAVDASNGNIMVVSVGKQVTLWALSYEETTNNRIQQLVDLPLIGSIPTPLMPLKDEDTKVEYPVVYMENDKMNITQKWPLWKIITCVHIVFLVLTTFYMLLNISTTDG